MVVTPSVFQARRTRWMAIVLVTAVHIAAFWLFARTRTEVSIPVSPPIFNVVLLPRVDLGSQPDVGKTGGAATAPSRTHKPPVPHKVEQELEQPRIQADEQPHVIGLANIDSEQPGLGQGGSGDGRGAGVGDGDGGGGRTAPILIQGPAHAAISEAVSRASLYDSTGAHVVLRCQLRLTERLERCRVVGEHPRPSGYRREALARAREFRIKPPTSSGRALDRQAMTIALAFPAPAKDADKPSG